MNAKSIEKARGKRLCVIYVLLCGLEVVGWNGQARRFERKTINGLSNFYIFLFLFSKKVSKL